MSSLYEYFIIFFKKNNNQNHCFCAISGTNWKKNVAREDEAHGQIVIHIVAPSVVHVGRAAIVAVPAIQAVTVAVVLKKTREKPSAAHKTTS